MNDLPGGQTIDGTLDALALLRDADPDMTVTQAMTLLAVAGQPNIAVLEAAERVGCDMSTASRNLGILGAHGRKNESRQKPGRRLVQQYEHPKDRRFKLAVLTPAGHELLGRFFSRLAGPVLEAELDEEDYCEQCHLPGCLSNDGESECSYAYLEDRV